MYTYETRVTTSCTDWTGTQTMLSTVTLMQDCSMLWMDDMPKMRSWLNDEGAAMMVASREVFVYRRPAYGEKLTVKTWIYDVRGPMGYRNTCIFDETGEAVAACWAVGVFVRFADNKMLKVPQEVIDETLTGEKYPLEYGKRKIKLPDVDPIDLGHTTVQRSDIDFNGHMNNAQYIRVAYEHLPQEFEPTHLRIVHEGQAKLGQAIDVKLYEEEGRRCYTLSSDEGKLFAVIEFS